MGSLRAFMKHIEHTAGVPNIGHFTRGNLARIDFIEKLNRLGSRNIKNYPREAIPDIDTTVELNHEEWTQLSQELETLLNSEAS